MAKRVLVPERVIRHLGRWYDEGFVAEATVLRGSILGWLFGVFGQHAVTINRTVHLTPRAPDLEADRGIALLGHECYHILQQSEMGWWRFLARYVWGWRPSHIRRGWEHPLERPAYDRGREVREALRD